jgi:predicted Mrr-cat superfamily restriction endonuclease
MSKSQETLETASKAVGAACRALVRQVQSMIKDRDQDEERVDYGKLGAHEFKVREMEQQVRFRNPRRENVLMLNVDRLRFCNSRIIWRPRDSGWAR